MNKLVDKLILVFIVMGVIVYLVNYKFGFNPDTSTTFAPNDSAIPLSTPTSSPISMTQESASPSPSGSLVHAVKVYLVAINDNGKIGPRIGCGDSVTAVER